MKMRKEKLPGKQGPIWHINGFIATKLGERLRGYNEEECYKLIDYLSEWTLPYSKDKHIVELIREKIEKNKKNESRYYTTEELYTYTILLFRDIHTPEKIMENLLEEKEWQRLQIRIANRYSLDTEFVKRAIEEHIEEVLGRKPRLYSTNINKNDLGLP